MTPYLVRPYKTKAAQPLQEVFVIPKVVIYVSL